MNGSRKKPADPQIVVILRAAAGAYLLYLSWGLRDAAFSGGNPLYLPALIAFGAAGIALLYVSVQKLRAGDFLRPWETPAAEEDSREEDEQDQQKGEEAE